MVGGGAFRNSGRMPRPSLIPLLPATAALLLLLSACAPAEPAESTGTDSSTEQSGGDGATTEDDPGFDGVVLPGTGSYAIGVDMPYGGYELDGTDSQPDGCTWSIQDADGVVSFADQGPFVFITDVPESVTFVTVGCPDWVQFE